MSAADRSEAERDSAAWARASAYRPGYYGTKWSARAPSLVIATYVR